MSIETIEQGGTLAFTFSVSGDAGLSCQIMVKQNPTDTTKVDRAITAVGNDYPGVLTNAETSTLGVGYWYIHARLTDADEDLPQIKPFYVRPKWTS